MTTSNPYKLAKQMRWTAQIVGLIAAGFFLAIFIGEAIGDILSEGQEVIEIAGILLGLLGGLALAGTIVSWWRERLAGILLTLTSVGLGIHISVYAGRNHFLAWLMVGFPYLVAAVLLFYSRWLLKKTF